MADAPALTRELRPRESFRAEHKKAASILMENPLLRGAAETVLLQAVMDMESTTDPTKAAAQFYQLIGVRSGLKALLTIGDDRAVLDQKTVPALAFDQPKR